MQSIKEFISELETKKIKLWTDGAKLNYKAPSGVITQDILNHLRDRKQEIIDYFAALGSGNIFYAPIQKIAPQEYYPLSAGQLRMFMLDRIDKKSTAYNLTQGLKIEGEVNQNQLTEILNRLVARHESLRTAFDIIEGNPVQKIFDKIDFNVEYEQIENTKENIDRVIEGFIRPYQLSKPPLFKFKLVKLLDHSSSPLYLLIQDMHHIISDGVSEAILVKEVNDLFAQISLPELRIQYKDYVAWHQKLLSGDEIQAQKRYWMEQLSQELPLLNLPVDLPRPQVFSFQGDSVRLQIPKDLADKLYNLARENRVTLFTALFTVYSVLLARYTGQNEIIIGTPTAGRRHADTANIIGVFVNTLALKVSYAPEQSFAEFMRKVGEQVISAFDNQDYPFEYLVEDLNVPRDLSRNPIFDTMFVLQNMYVGEIKVQGLGISRYEFQAKIAQVDLTVIATQNNAGIEIEFNYCSSLFRKETIVHFGEHYMKVIASVIENPRVKLREIEILSREEKILILSQFNDTTSPYGKEKTIHELFEAQVEKTPENYALVFGDKQLTYRELNEKANQIAKVLRNQGITRDNIVGIMVERSFAMIIGILGILKAGGAYLPIDPNFPADRIKYMVEDSKTAILLTQENLKPKVEFKGTVIDLNDPDLYRGDNTNPPKINNARDLAYVIYTSGSTGNPKGVMIEHCAVHNFIHGITARIGFSPAKTILALTTISFDIFVLETLLPLSAGLKVVIAGEQAQKDPKILKELITQNQIDMLQATPSRLQMLFTEDEDAPCLGGLREIMIGGEALPPVLLEKVRKVTGAKIYNMYGPTETTVWSSVKDLTADGHVNIGKPIANTYMYILDNNHGLQPVGIAGELYIAGDGLARGYLNQPGLTAEKFIPNSFFSAPFKEFRVKSDEFRVKNETFNNASEFQLLTLNSTLSTDEEFRVKTQKSSDKLPLSTLNSQLATLNSQLKNDSQLMYKTGDLARWLPNGEIDFLGRIDYQVKIRGFRIELGEIESHLMMYEPVKKAVVIDREDTGSNKYLCAYLVAEKELDAEELRKYLSLKLPDYMVPSYFLQADTLPMTPNGKIDRKALPAPDGSLRTRLAYVAPRTEIELKLAELWQETLDIDRIGIYDNFFNLGGHSILAIKLQVKMEKSGILLELSDIFKYPTIKEMAEWISPATPPNSAAELEYYPNNNNPSTAGINQTEILITGDGPRDGEILTDFEPFNEVFYISCLYNNLFSIIRHFKMSIHLFLINNALLFGPCPDNAFNFQLRYKSNKSILEVLDDMGIGVRSKTAVNDIVQDIQGSIKNGEPVIIWVDGFYEPWRANVYQKNHWPFTLLIYGYDEERQGFYIIENRHRDNLTYEKRFVGYQEVSNAYRGYLANIGTEEETYYEFYLDYAKKPVNPDIDDLYDQTSIITAFQKNITLNKDEICEGLKHLERFKNDLKRTILDKAMLQKDVDVILQLINDMVNAKRVEKYKLINLLGEDHPSVDLLLELLDSTMECWSVPRAVIGKYKFSGDYYQEEMEILPAKINEAYQHERNYIEMIFSGVCAPPEHL